MSADRDEHLAQALKHAPDAGISAPARLGEQIVAAARQALADEQTATRSRPRWGTGWWTGWLTPSPGSWGRTGAVATVLMAGLLTWMWQAPAPEPAPEGPPIAQAPAVESAPVALPALRREEPATAAGQMAPPSEQRRGRALAAAPPRPPVQATRAAAAALPGTAAPEISGTLPPAPPAPPPAPPPGPPTTAVAAAPPSADAAPAVVAEAANRARVDTTPAFGSRSMLTAPAQPAPAGLAAWLQRQPPNLSWQIDGGLRAAASLPWLQRLAASTGGRWQSIGNAPAGPAATTLLLLSGAEPVARLTLHDDHVRWCDATAAACSRAALTADVIATLQKELPR